MDTISFIPRGWTCSDAGRDRFGEMAAEMRRIVGFQLRFHAPGFDEEDWAQAGMVAAMYACDTFDPERGVALTTYVAKLVRRALMMTARNALCPTRAQHVADADGKAGPVSPCSLSDLDGDLPDAGELAEGLLIREAERDAACGEIERLRSCLAPRSRDLLDARIRQGGDARGGGQASREIGMLPDESRVRFRTIMAKARRLREGAAS